MLLGEEQESDTKTRAKSCLSSGEDESSKGTRGKEKTKLNSGRNKITTRRGEKMHKQQGPKKRGGAEGGAGQKGFPWEEQNVIQDKEVPISQ